MSIGTSKMSAECLLTTSRAPLIADGQQFRPVPGSENHRMPPPSIVDGNHNAMSDGAVGIDQRVNHLHIDERLVSQQHHEGLGIGRRSF